MNNISSQVCQQQSEAVTWRDYLELCKPRVVALMILTSLIGMCLASKGPVSLNVLIFGNLGIALAAFAAAAINHLADRHIDKVMRRTQNRPIVKGKISVIQTLLFATTLAALSMFVLIYFINPLTALLSLLTLILYAGVYTLYLKYATSQNIVIGGIAGAAPPLLGWVAVTGQVDPTALLLVLIIFVWTPPHFWALAIHRVDDYAKAKVPMLPNTHGIYYTKLCILCYTLLLLAVSLLPFVIGSLSWFYLLGALFLGFRFVYWAVRLLVSDSKTIPMRVFRYSIVYLMLLFVIMLIDHYCC